MGKHSKEGGGEGGGGVNTIVRKYDFSAAYPIMHTFGFRDDSNVLFRFSTCFTLSNQTVIIVSCCLYCQVGQAGPTDRLDVLQLYAIHLAFN